MNYLAHAYLSFANPKILVGNMVSDYVKGKKKFTYAQEVQTGMQLHRAIDQFTDSHIAVQTAKSIFRPAYRLYAGAFVDVAFDYFLANDPLEFSDEQALKAFTTETYKRLQDNEPDMPEVFRMMLPNMIEQDWLFHYRFKAGIERSFIGLKKRARYIGETSTAFQLFNDHLDDLKQQYDLFFPELKKFAHITYNQLLS